ncbi:hypothetical protein BKK81_10080 [Cupriavidus sp. USMAHM13]|uniref:helix-turn-helix transcriptional regulator n=1 Tax=Cupriavidus sp. USMAHM13 TaxID=1389192 RepID=UPI0008A71102|nr:LuxR C-terminal-related transcriptional regulator [Cupriavidus sp. USMAHM13]AOY99572.1 hypothetical protein BKK81_10080 [Cupriavidus sp. USMAHM13]
MIQHPAGPAVGETSRELRLAASVSRLLLPLYRLALHEPIGAFERQVLGLLREFIDFDSAWLGCSTLTPGGPSLHSSQTLDTAPDFVAEWEQCKADDPLVALAAGPGGHAGHAGHAVALCVRHAPLPAPMRILCARQRIRHVLCGAQVALPARRATHLSLYRAPGRRPYAERDVRLMACVIGHLDAALDHNRQCRLRAMRAVHDTAAVPQAAALADAWGRILHADASFLAQLQQAWPGWHGAALPEPLRLRLQPGTGGHLANARIRLSWEPEGDLLLVRASPPAPGDLLAPRELAVARLFGSGLSHKEVARRLGIAPTTVRHHLRQAYAKLEVSDKGALASRLLG